VIRLCVVFCLYPLYRKLNEVLSVYLTLFSRGLREARDMALAEKERVAASERDANAKCDHILQE
jgi:hypothetical protein